MHFEEEETIHRKHFYNVLQLDADDMIDYCIKRIVDTLSFVTYVDEEGEVAALRGKIDDVLYIPIWSHPDFPRYNEKVSNKNQVPGGQLSRYCLRRFIKVVMPILNEEGISIYLMPLVVENSMRHISVSPEDFYNMIGYQAQENYGEDIETDWEDEE